MLAAMSAALAPFSTLTWMECVVWHPEDSRSVTLGSGSLVGCGFDWLEVTGFESKWCWHTFKMYVYVYFGFL